MLQRGRGKFQSKQLILLLLFQFFSPCWWKNENKATEFRDKQLRKYFAGAGLRLLCEHEICPTCPSIMDLNHVAAPGNESE